MEEYLSFRKMITPVLIQALFWLGVVFAVITALRIMFSGTFLGFLSGVVALAVLPLMVRIYCELLIVLFQIYDELRAIRNTLAPPPANIPVVPTATAIPPVYTPPA